jgi:hypothetical protein
VGNGLRFAAVVAVADDVVALVVLFEVGDEAAVDQRRKRIHLFVQSLDTLFGLREFLLDGIDVLPQLSVVVFVASPKKNETCGERYDVRKLSHFSCCLWDYCLIRTWR